MILWFWQCHKWPVLKMNEPDNISVAQESTRARTHARTHAKANHAWSWEKTSKFKHHWICCIHQFSESSFANLNLIKLTWTLTTHTSLLFFSGSSNHHHSMFITHMHAAPKGHMDKFSWWVLNLIRFSVLHLALALSVQMIFLMLK